jgi:putative ABC transport system permease protein
MMGSLGLTRWEITAVFFFEAIFLSVIGALVGCIIGGLVTAIGSHFPLGAALMGGTQQKETPMASAVFLAFSFKSILQGFLFGVVIASICTFIPSAKCAFIEPVDALRQ